LLESPQFGYGSFDLTDEDSRERNSDLLGSCEDSLSDNERASKGRFDVGTELLLPGYVADVYESGRWTRRLWAFAKDTMQQNEDFDRYDGSLRDWKSLVSSPGSSGCNPEK